MNSLMRNLSGGARIVGGTAAYLLVTAVEVVPTTREIAGNLGVSVSVRDVWIGISAIAIIVALRLDSLLSRGYLQVSSCDGYGGASATWIAEVETAAEVPHCLRRV